ncbi:hypothetical protein [Amycolatopsis nigrescens]|uniref:hypothetical protein n=1 Tax=Amycolatopsis nigrescens TaxID=381445 RepID=UPI0003765B84|nr:hypothetical protein [Amycolatopsis nigrescens]
MSNALIRSLTVLLLELRGRFERACAGCNPPATGVAGFENLEGSVKSFPNTARGLLVAAGIGLAIAGAGVVPATAAEKPDNSTVSTQWANAVGVWRADITRDDGVSEKAYFRFFADGKLGLEVDDGSTGHGRWWPAGNSKFGFKFVQPVYDGSGTQIGEVRAAHDAVLNADRQGWTSKGTGTFYDNNGQVVVSAKVSVVAVKVA